MITAWDFPVGKREPWNFLLESGVLLLMLATLGEKDRVLRGSPDDVIKLIEFGRARDPVFRFFVVVPRTPSLCVYVCVCNFFLSFFLPRHTPPPPFVLY